MSTTSDLWNQFKNMESTEVGHNHFKEMLSDANLLARRLDSLRSMLQAVLFYSGRASLDMAIEVEMLRDTLERLSIKVSQGQIDAVAVLSALSPRKED
jgi:hypothetical protein